MPGKRFVCIVETHYDAMSIHKWMKFVYYFIYFELQPRLLVALKDRSKTFSYKTNPNYRNGTQSWIH